MFLFKCVLPSILLGHKVQEFNKTSVSLTKYTPFLMLHFQVSRNIELGLAALRGEKGPAYDRIILNAGIVDHLLGCDGAEDISAALDRAREAIASGKALDRLLNYIKMSHKVR